MWILTDPRNKLTGILAGSILLFLSVYLRPLAYLLDRSLITILRFPPPAPPVLRDQKV